MARATATDPHRGDTRRRLLDAAVALVRERGFTAASVDDLCRAAGVTKGAYFHHFANKERLAVAAAGWWSERAEVPEPRAVLAARQVLGVSPEGLARHIQGAIQGAIVLAKAADDPAPALESLAHLGNYLALLFRMEERVATTGNSPDGHGASQSKP